MSRATRWWSGIGSRLRRGPNQTPEPEAAAALERAIAGLHEQHRMIVDQAAQIVATSDREQALLDRAVDEQRRLTAATVQAVRSADDATAAGRPDEAARWEATAESLATRMLSTEQEVAERRAAAADAGKAAARARDVVDRSAAAVRTRITDYQRLRSDLDEAKLQESLNDTLHALDPDAGGAGMATARIGRTIEERLATARALTELRAEPTSMRQLELEHELSQLDARSVVSGLRREPRDDADPSTLAPSEPQSDTASGPDPG